MREKQIKTAEEDETSAVFLFAVSAARGGEAKVVLRNMQTIIVKVLLKLRQKALTCHIFLCKNVCFYTIVIRSARAFMKKILSLVLSVFLIFNLASCAEYASASSLVHSFTDAYGAVGTVYFPGAREGEVGYMDGEFYERIYGVAPDFECDFAVLLTHSPTEPEECGVFITKDDTSRLYVIDTVSRRVGFLRDMGYGEAAVVIVRRDVVFYSTFREPERVERIWRDIRLTL